MVECNKYEMKQMNLILIIFQQTFHFLLLGNLELPCFTLIMHVSATVEYISDPSSETGITYLQVVALKYLKASLCWINA